jgi:hypothetical protein
MNAIGILAAALFVITGILMISPLLIVRAIKESYKKCDFWKFIENIPVWLHYLVMGWLSILFWIGLGYLLFVYSHLI